MTSSQAFQYWGRFFTTFQFDWLFTLSSFFLSEYFFHQSSVAPCSLLVLLQFWLRHRWTQSLEDIDLSLQVVPDLLLAVTRWLYSPCLLRGVPLTPPTPTMTLCTDSSLQRWEDTPRRSHHFWSWTYQESLLHINVLGMRAILLSLIHFVAHLR